MSRQRTVLIVDDDPNVREVLCEVFSGQQYQVLTAESAQQAIDAVEKQSVDVAIVDMVMPLAADGVSTLRRIKAVSPKTVVIMMTGCAPPEWYEWAREAGAFCCLDKPFSINKLCKLVEDALR